MRIVSWIMIGLAGLGLAACAPGDSGQHYQLRYGFRDSQTYRIDAKYVFTDTLVKSHQQQRFLEKTDIVHVTASFTLKVTPGDENTLTAEYSLRNINVQDGGGNFRLELSPQNGEIFWYGETQRFDTYFDEGEFRRYLDQVGRPLALVTIDARGVQQVQTSQGNRELSFNMDLIKLLGKNRAIGKIVVKTLKIPPVLMTILSNQPVWPGRQWIYQGDAVPQIAQWDHPLTTVFKLKDVREQGLAIEFHSEMSFTGDELTALGKQMGLEDFEKVSFQESKFFVNGNSIFDPDSGRPVEGNMRIEKKYGLKSGEEDWKLSEVQEYHFSVHPLGD